MISDLACGRSARTWRFSVEEKATCEPDEEREAGLLYYITLH